MRGLLVRYGLAMTSVVLVAFLVPLGLFARSLAQDAAVDRARQDAQSVAVFAGGATEDRTRLEAEVLRVNGSARRTTVFLPDGAVVGEVVEPTAATELASLGRAFVARADGGMEVVLPVAGAAGTSVVRTYVPDAELNRGVTRAWVVLLAVGAVLLAGTALAGDRVAARLSRSVLDLSGVADRLGAGDLSARVEPSGPPEVASVGRVLNGLGARVARLLAGERELVADLSHRLRTPMTALRLDVELLADPRERARLTGHVDELVQAVDTVVRTARDPEGEPPAAVCDAARVVRDRAEFWRVLADAQGRPLRTQVAAAPVPVGLREQDLGAALDVLVDNVFSHTPDGTGFTLAVVAGDVVGGDVVGGDFVGGDVVGGDVVGGDAPDGWVRIVVADDGPGFDPRLVERGRSGAGSTGLGLDVARRAAQDAGGRMLIDPGEGSGARITLEVPRRDAPTA